MPNYSSSEAVNPGFNVAFCVSAQYLCAAWRAAYQEIMMGIYPPGLLPINDIMFGVTMIGATGDNFAAQDLGQQKSTMAHTQYWALPLYHVPCYFQFSCPAQGRIVPAGDD